MSLWGNSVLLGITEGYVSAEQLPYIGCGVVIYMTVPVEHIHQIYENHRFLHPSELTAQPWGDLAFEVEIGDYRFMIAAQQGTSAD